MWHRGAARPPLQKSCKKTDKGWPISFGAICICGPAALLKNFDFFLQINFFLMFLDHFDVLMSKINFLKKLLWCISKQNNTWKATTTIMLNTTFAFHSTAEIRLWTLYSPNHDNLSALYLPIHKLCKWPVRAPDAIANKFSLSHHQQLCYIIHWNRHSQNRKNDSNTPTFSNQYHDCLSTELTWMMIAEIGLKASGDSLVKRYVLRWEISLIPIVNNQCLHFLYRKNSNWYILYKCLLFYKQSN